MIQLPDFTRPFDYENNFLLSCDPNRISKILAYYELMKLTAEVPGAIVECGVLKGASFALFAMMREVLGGQNSRKLIGFDTFDTFPETSFSPDKAKRKEFIDEAGQHSISAPQLKSIIEWKKISLSSVELVEGDISETVPAFLQKCPEFRISLLNLDTDIYEPAVVILEHLYPRIAQGGVLIVDNYGVFPGETKAVDDYFAHTKVTVRRLPFRETPCYVIKD